MLTENNAGPDVDTRQIYQETLRHFLAPIWPLMEDGTVSEVLINGHDKVYFERSGRLHLSELSFPTEERLMIAVRNIAEYVGRTIDADHHSMDARLPDGSRVHVIIAPASRGGAHVSIRKFQKSSFSLASQVQWGSLTEEAVEFLSLVVRLHKNTVISGGTGTGKTSMLNALTTAIPEHERIVVIEDSSELQLQQDHAVYLEAQPRRPDGRGEVTIRDLFVDALRMRPDRIVVGEVRRGEALDMIQSMISGHAGALTTVHANTPRDALIRLETLSMMSGIDIPVHVARRQVGSAVNVIIQLTRFDDGSRRVQTISEVRGLDDKGDYITCDLYQFRPEGRDDEGRILGQLRPTSEIPSFTHEPFQLGLGDGVILTRNKFAPE
jgi:pilus assembly protein CpaF